MNHRWALAPAGGVIAAALALLLAPPPAIALVTPASTAAPGQRLALALPLAIDSSRLTRFAAGVSTPGSAKYGDYRSVRWLAEHFGASARSRSLVVAYLRHHGARDVNVDATGLFVDAQLTVAAAQQLFDTSLSSPRVGRSRFTLPATPVRIPPGLDGLVTGVIGLDTAASFAAPQAVVRPHAAPSCPSGSGGLDDPGCMAASSGYAGPDGSPQGCAAGLAPAGFAPNEYLSAYQYDALHESGTRGQGERVALIEISGFNAADIDEFAGCFGLAVPPIEAHPVGLRQLLPAGGEATLDLEVLDAAASELKSIDVYEVRPDAVDVLRGLTAPLRRAGDKPDVISVSLGLCEADTLSAVGHAGIRVAEAALEEAAAAGITVLGASGDSGSAGCVSSASNPTPPLPELAVTYPASSPWVTSVGGTNLTLNSANSIVNEVVWNDAAQAPGQAGGGGLSILFGRPRYQDGVISADRRAVPDVALLADIAPGYDVYCTAEAQCDNRGWVVFGGTSAATPLLAGGVALIDQLLRESKRQPLGLLNGLLYKLARTGSPAGQPLFYDVTEGSNDVGPFIQENGALLGCCNATSGFDEASGWGGIDLAVLARDAQSTQLPAATVALLLAVHQHPLSRHGITARVRCNRDCDLIVRARLLVGKRQPFTAYVKLVELKPHRLKTVNVAFSKSELQELRFGMQHHLAVSADVTSAVVDPGGNVVRQSPTLSVELSKPRRRRHGSSR